MVNGTVDQSIVNRFSSLAFSALTFLLLRSLDGMERPRAELRLSLPSSSMKTENISKTHITACGYYIETMFDQA